MDRMTGAELAAKRHLLGLSRAEFAEILGIGDRTARAWESERDLIPARIPGILDALLAEHRDLAQQMASEERIIALPRGESSRPRGWYVGAAARALVIEPDLMIEWGE